jgi:ABC-type Mn2+/Zn2+ transport system ATPase subunit
MKVATEIELLARKIETIERVTKSDDLAAHRQVQQQARWAQEVDEGLDEVTESIPDEALLDEAWPPSPPRGPADTILAALGARLVEHRDRIEQHRAALVAEAEAARATIDQAIRGQFEAVRRPLLARYEEQVAALHSESVDLGQLDGLHAKVAAARKQEQRLAALPAQLDDLDAAIATAVAALVAQHDERRAVRQQVDAEFQDRDGEFRSIARGSLGQRNTAVLSLLLTAGSGPLLLDQPEDDLDNRYIYDVVVDLLRATKTTRQIIAATHNANIPVNGDAECIIALDPSPDRDQPLLTGSLEQAEMKEAVSSITEGSESAFRLRRQRYGY